MNSKLFYLLLSLSLMIHIFGVEEQGNFSWLIGKLKGAAAKGIEHYVDHGKGELAKEQLAQKDAIIERQGKNIEAFALVSKDAHNGGEPSKITQNIQNSNGPENNNFDPYRTLSATKDSIYIVKSGYDFYKFMYTCIWPNPEDQLYKDTVIKQLAILGAENQLNKCLVRNVYTGIENDVVPSKCEDVGFLFAELAGPGALDKIMCQYSLLKKRIRRD